MPRKIAKVEYQSPYKCELVQYGNLSFVIQYVDDKDSEFEKRKIIFNKRNRIGCDLKMTPYFQKRCENIIKTLFETQNASELIEVIAKSSNVSMSGYFKYRDYLDILKQKSLEMHFETEDEKFIISSTIKSLELSNVIAPKIPAICKYMGLVSSTQNQEEQ